MHLAAPCLRTLDLHGCSSLRSLRLPASPYLEVLNATGCAALAAIYPPCVAPDGDDRTDSGNGGAGGGAPTDLGGGYGGSGRSLAHLRVCVLNMCRALDDDFLEKLTRHCAKDLRLLEVYGTRCRI